MGLRFVDGRRRVCLMMDVMCDGRWCGKGCGCFEGSRESEAVAVVSRIRGFATTVMRCFFVCILVCGRVVEIVCGWM